MRNVTLSLVGLFVATLLVTGCGTKAPEQVAPPAPPVVETVPEVPAVPTPAANAFMTIEPLREFSSEFQAAWGDDEVAVINITHKLEMLSGGQLTPEQIQFVLTEVVPRYKTLAQQNFNALGLYAGTALTVAELSELTPAIVAAVLASKS